MKCSKTTRFRSTALYKGYRATTCYARPRPFVVFYRTAPYHWNWLGKIGRSEHGATWGHKFFDSQEDAKQFVKSRRTVTHDGEMRMLTNEIGNNDHLIGVRRYDEFHIAETTVIDRWEVPS